MAETILTFSFYNDESSYYQYLNNIDADISKYSKAYVKIERFLIDDIKMDVAMSRIILCELDEVTMNNYDNLNTEKYLVPSQIIGTFIIDTLTEYDALGTATHTYQVNYQSTNDTWTEINKRLLERGLHIRINKINKNTNTKINYDIKHFLQLKIKFV